MPEHVYNPKLKSRPAPQHPMEPAGRIHLDVVVTGQSGHPVRDFTLQDFTLLDENQPRKIASFEFIDGGTAKPDPPVEVILLIDRLNATFQQVSFAKSEVSRLLRRQNGHLPIPISIALLTRTGLQIQKRPSVDGHALLSILDPIEGDAATIDHRLGGLSLFDKFLLSVQQLDELAGVQSRRPGRKLLIWIGPGWKINADFAFQGRDQQLLFNTIVQITNRLREARLTLYDVSSDDVITSVSGFNQVDDLNAIAADARYESSLKPVRSQDDAVPEHLGLKIFAIHSGGRVLGPNNDLVQQIDACIRDANTFYRISFDPSPAVHEHEYHDLKIQLNRPGLTARTCTGYYNEPATK